VISIVENLSKYGAPIPARLVDGLLLLKKLRMKRATEEQLRDPEGS